MKDTRLTKEIHGEYSDINEQRTREILDLRKEGCSMAKIGEAFGISKQRVFTIIQEANRPKPVLSTNNPQPKRKKRVKRPYVNQRYLDWHRREFKDPNFIGFYKADKYLY